ncbi:MAG: hypothetical protein KBE65_19390 [Phycisphaerae bacterium]|nr:hypothetical protein [Phycisphaerae bacterium]
MMNRLLRFSLLALTMVLWRHCDATFGELKVHLKLDGNLADSAGGDHNGALLDGSRGSHQYISGKLDEALDLVNEDYPTDGDGVSIAYTMTDAGTVALWYQPRRIYNYNTIYDNSANPDDWECWIYSDGRLRARVESDTYVTADLVSLSSAGNPQGEWFHMAFLWDRTSASTVKTGLYINGIEQGANSGTWVAPGNRFYLGGGHTGNDCGDGTWDDVRIYDHVLSKTELGSLAMRGLIVEPNLIQLSEGQTASYTVMLDRLEGCAPREDLYVSISADDDLSINDLAPGEVATLVFERATYLTPQTVRITAVDDSAYLGNRNVTLTHSIMSADAYWDQMQDVQMMVSILEDDLTCGDWGYNEMDFNRDCAVDWSDLALFAAQWMACTDPSRESCQYARNAVVVAHRGFSAAAPENTIAACNAARGFADGVEFDVRVTSDNQLILMHDDTVDRTTDGIGTVAGMTLAELRRLDAGSWFSPDFSGEFVPLMSEAILATMPDMRPVIERKTGSAAAYVELIRVLKIERRVTVIAFDWDFLAEVETLAPAIQTGALGSDALTLTEIKGIQSRGIDLIDWEHSTVTPETIGLVHAYGMELYVWTVDDADRMATLIGLGIDGITTNDPELARELVEAR